MAKEVCTIYKYEEEIKKGGKGMGLNDNRGKKVWGKVIHETMRLSLNYRQFQFQYSTFSFRVSNLITETHDGNEVARTSKTD